MKLKALVLLCLLATTAFGQVMINEMLYDTQGTDDTAIMYTEIYGPAGTNLAGWSLVNINGNGGVIHLTVNLTGTIPDDGYYVVGGASVPGVDQVTPHDFQNAGGTGGPQCDGLDLVNNSGQTVDHLCYGECAAAESCDGEGGGNAPDPFPSGGLNRVLARIPDHTDTDHNATDWVASDTQTPGAPNSGEPCEPINAMLEDVRANDGNGVPELNGEFVIVRGVVNINNYVVDDSTSSFFVQDDNAGVNVFGGGVQQGIAEGDCVEVSGWVSNFNGLTEIVSSGAGNCSFRVDVLEGNAEVEPLVLTGASAFEAFEGMLIEMRNVTIVDGDWPTGPTQNASLTITDGNGTVGLRIDRDTGVWQAGEPAGAFTVRGILTQFDDSSPYSDGYQITPRYVSDIMGTAADDRPLPLAQGFELVNTYPNPFNGVATIEFAVGSSREIAVTITDVLGREVYATNLANLTPGAHRLQWAPTGAAGLYFVRATSGATIATTKLLYLK